LRRFTFALLFLTLLGVVVWTAVEGPRGTAGRPEVATSVAARRIPARPAPPLDGDLARAARRFLLAFLDYEVGARRAWARRAICAGAVGRLARQILSHPSRQRSLSRSAHLEALRIVAIPAHGRLVLVSGSARRRRGLEAFAFIFGRRGERWLALAPGE
jgi:hypothetical protein